MIYDRSQSCGCFVSLRLYLSFRKYTLADLTRYSWIPIDRICPCCLLLRTTVCYCVIHPSTLVRPTHVPPFLYSTCVRKHTPWPPRIPLELLPHYLFYSHSTPILTRPFAPNLQPFFGRVASVPDVYVRCFLRLRLRSVRACVRCFALLRTMWDSADS